MGVRNDKTRTQLTIEKELKSQLEVIAKEDNRSFNNLIISVLKEFVKTRYDEDNSVN